MDGIGGVVTDVDAGDSPHRLTDRTLNVWLDMAKPVAVKVGVVDEPTSTQAPVTSL